MNHEGPEHCSGPFLVFLGVFKGLSTFYLMPFSPAHTCRRPFLSETENQGYGSGNL